jgi:tetratricopeptide (TPR) repeat protein
MTTRIGPVVVVLLTVALLPCFAQEEGGEPAWVTYQRGVHALERGNLGEAVRSFRDALAVRRPFPEAEAGIGQVFEAEGNIPLAVRQYRRALEEADAFYIGENEFAVRYELAELFRNQGRWKDYEEELLVIADRNPQFRPDHDPPYRRLVPNVLTREPLEDRPPQPRLDILLRLYRLEENFAYRAHLEAGEQFLRNGRYSGAVDHLSFAVVASLSTLVSELRRDIYGYEFETTEGLITDALTVERLRAYIDDTELFRALFRLSGALYGFEGAGAPDGVPREIWDLLVSFPQAAGVWAARAGRAVERPRTALNVDY